MTHKNAGFLMRMGWSLLTLLLTIYRASYTHENQTERSAGGSLSHVWRETGRNVRTQHWPTTNRAPSRPTLSGFGEVNRAETSDDSWQ
jgi:hypothetical protein